MAIPVHSIASFRKRATSFQSTDAPLSIVHIIAGLTIGGAERMLERLVMAQLDNPDLKHSVISLRDLGPIGKALSERGVAVEAIGLDGFPSLPRAFLRLVRRLRALRPDIVQTWMYHADLIGGLAARRAGVPVLIWGVRATSFGRRQGVARLTSLVRALCAGTSRRLPSRIVYVANSARTYHERLGYLRAKGIVIPNGYVLPDLAAVDPFEVRRRYVIPQSAPVIGSVGRFSGLKDHETFVLACGQVMARRPDVHALMVGPDVDPANASLMSWIDQTGYSDRFHLTGAAADLWPLYAAMDIFCLHSRAEAFPNVVAEAMASAVPCVVTDVGDAAELVGETGLIAPPADPDALALRLLKMLAEHEMQRRRRGQAARGRIEAGYSLSAISSRYEALYASLTGRGESVGDAAGESEKRTPCGKERTA